MTWHQTLGTIGALMLLWALSWVSMNGPREYLEVLRERPRNGWDWFLFIGVWAYTLGAAAFVLYWAWRGFSG